MLARLDRYVRDHPGTSSSAVANMFIDESLLLRASGRRVPGRSDGPAGSPGRGPDVWEIVAALHAVRDEAPQLEGDELTAGLVAVTGLSAAQVGTALRYYAAYPDEIDERVTSNREEEVWSAQQRILRRPPA
ncbi:hypothetical protein AB0K20_31165 [Micromonospora matsumotoense]|uniref:hypothetical protein n=1 Tax=Micromonospora matsumotoense TaxID=121616 RepID=UPI003425EDAB